MWSFVNHTYDQAIIVQKDMITFIQGLQTKYAGLCTQVDMAQDVKIVESINW
jgi:hypothetical protein